MKSRTLVMDAAGLTHTVGYSDTNTPDMSKADIIARFLKERGVSEDDIATVIEMLGGAEDQADPIRPFPGKPTLGGDAVSRIKLALDHAPARLRRFALDRLERNQARSAERYSEMFPNASRVQVL
jgi:hypothetical protein